MNKNNLNFWMIAGLVDAEGSFVVNIVKDKNDRFKVLAYFELALNEKDKFLLECLRKTLGVGNIFFNQLDSTYKFKVSNTEELYSVIIPFFIKYNLLTQKRADFELFSQIIEIIKRKDHLTTEGLQRIVNLKVNLNRGLSYDLKKFFPDTVAVCRPKIDFVHIPDPNWLVGFSEGESCFFVRIYRSNKSKQGLAVQLAFSITQHFRDKELLDGIKNFLGCGRVAKRSGEYCDFVVNSLSDLDEKIIPLFLKYPLPGSKELNFIDFKKVLEMMKNKDHLSEEGLLKIKKIKCGMNTARH